MLNAATGWVHCCREGIIGVKHARLTERLPAALEDGVLRLEARLDIRFPMTTCAGSGQQD